MVFGLFKKKEPVKVTIKGSGETFMCNPDELLMKAALRQKIKKVIIPNKPADIPAGPVINNQKIVEAIYNIVVDYYKVSRAELVGKCRDQYLVIPRCMIANLMRECTALSFPEISRIMNRDHTSIIHYVKCRIGSSSFWKIPNNHKIYNYLKTEVLNETRKR